MKIMGWDSLREIRSSFNSTGKMPVLFLGHGSPMNAIEENEFVAGFRKLGETLPLPQAILCISAHWETKGTFVTAMDMPSTIHDFGGFPLELFKVQYPAPGSPALADEVQKNIRTVHVELDQKWGLDHGAWSVIKHMYPEANIPVIQMSLDYYQTIQYHYELAKELQFLRTKGVLIVGSGNVIHNLPLLAWSKMNDPEYGYDWALEANSKMKELILSGNHKTLIHYQTLGKAFNFAIPTPEHYLPLIYILGLQDKSEPIRFFNDKVIGGSLSMTSVVIGDH